MIKLFPRNMKDTPDKIKDLKQSTNRFDVSSGKSFSIGVHLDRSVFRRCRSRFVFSLLVGASLAHAVTLVLRISAGNGGDGPVT